MPFDGTTLSLEQHALNRLIFARDQIAAGHWCKGEFDDGDGNRCATGWLGWHEPAPHLPVYKAAVRSLWDALPRSARRGRIPDDDRALKAMTNQIVSYNDQRYRSRKAIVELFDRAIEAAS